ncbi:MAG: radical SAM family heme chaperone HemW [Deltaproteobacteria bacterium]|nr:radical SAM family heme chaperone HemW [Deltaproteobacteria bacterium]
MTLGIYIHIPFCVKKCPYCDFTSFTPETLPEDQYITALIREMEVRRAEVVEDVKVETVYFGGGTPSLLSPNSVKNLLIAISKEFTLKEPEITIEVNPGTVDLDKLKGYRDAGVNRLSLGIQSLNDRLLSVLGRIHNRKEALNAYESARKAGFQNIGIDLIHSVPGELLSDWKGDLKEAISLRPEHISAYNLTVEEETHFFRQQEKGLLALPKEEEQVAMFLETERILEGAGYEHYEVSNYAIPGFRSRHNQIYWKGGEYLGLGVSAHSCISGRLSVVSGQTNCGKRTANTSNLEEYFRLIKEKGNAIIEEEALTREKAMGEAVFLGLRMMEGIDLSYFKDRFGIGIDAAYPDAVNDLMEDGLLDSGGGHLRLTKKGILFLNDVSVRFV